MTTPDYASLIPAEAVEAGAKRICAVRFGEWFWAMAHESQKEDMRSEARAACTAMLAAWPGALTDHGFFYEDATSSLILPLPTEPKG